MIRDFLHDRGQQQCSGQADEALQQIRNTPTAAASALSSRKYSKK